MTGSTITYLGGPIFDGHTLRAGLAARFWDGQLVELGPESEINLDNSVVNLDGDFLSPGYVDLQVNGGDGIMFNDDPSVATLRRIAAAHRRLGATSILPTLITDTAEKTRAAIDAAVAALAAGVPGIAGLHLEGPHLSIARKGAHDAELIRKMETTDLEALLAAARKLPALKVTVAPENTSLEQVTALSRAGVIVSLGHTDAGFETCVAYAKAGARCATHLFNAMSQLGNREPGLVGAVLASGSLSAGLIADAIHVHPETMRAAWAAKTGPGSIFLVSDAMAVAGTDMTEFQLEGRAIRRKNGRLTLEDGTLAGADLDLTTAIRTLSTRAGVDLEQAMRAATSIPGALIGKRVELSTQHGVPLSDVIRISADLREIK